MSCAGSSEQGFGNEQDLQGVMDGSGFRFGREQDLQGALNGIGFRFWHEQNL